MNLRDGSTRVTVCKEGHITVEAIDEVDGQSKFVIVLDADEASRLSLDLSCAVASVRSLRSSALRVHARADASERERARRLVDRRRRDRVH